MLEAPAAPLPLSPPPAPPKVVYAETGPGHRSATREIRQLARCPRCKAAKSRLVTRTVYQSRHTDKFGHPRWEPYRWDYFVDGTTAAAAFTCACGREVFWRDVDGKYKAEEKCGAKCQASKGPSCECSCGGMNHGKSWS